MAAEILPPLSHLETVAGYTLEDIQHSEQKPCIFGGVRIHPDELVEMFNLLEANPAVWNHRLRVVCAGWLLHLIRQGKIQGHFEGTS